MSKRRRKFTEEFKAEAVRMLRESGRPLSQRARELGIVPSALERWNRQQRDAEQAGTTRTALMAEREELGRLRRENEVLPQERDF